MYRMLITLRIVLCRLYCAEKFYCTGTSRIFSAVHAVDEGQMTENLIDVGLNLAEYSIIM